MIIGPGLFTFTFAYFIDKARGWSVPGAPWYLGAGLLFVAMLMSMRVEKLPPVLAGMEGTIGQEMSGERDVTLSAATPPVTEGELEMPHTKSPRI